MIDGNLKRAESVLVELASSMLSLSDDDPKLEELREQLYDIECRLSVADTTILQELSSDLYILESNLQPPPRPLALDDLHAQRQIALGHIDSAKFHDALVLIRQLPLQREQHAQYFAKAWRGLGFDEAADCFERYATEATDNLK